MPAECLRAKPRVCMIAAMDGLGPARASSRTAGRLALVIAIVLGVGAGFSYVAGWLSPHRLTPAGVVDTFERVNGSHPGFRRNHAKGVSISGYFEANGAGTRLSKAGVFRVGQVPVPV